MTTPATVHPVDLHVDVHAAQQAAGVTAALLWQRLADQPVFDRVAAVVDAVWPTAYVTTARAIRADILTRVSEGIHRESGHAQPATDPEHRARNAIATLADSAAQMARDPYPPSLVVVPAEAYRDAGLPWFDGRHADKASLAGAITIAWRHAVTQATRDAAPSIGRLLAEGWVNQLDPALREATTADGRRVTDSGTDVIRRAVNASTRNPWTAPPSPAAIAVTALTASAPPHAPLGPPARFINSSAAGTDSRAETAAGTGRAVRLARQDQASDVTTASAAAAARLATGSRRVLPPAMATTTGRGRSR